MDTKYITHNGLSVAVLHSPTRVITDAQSALDIIASVAFENACHRVAINREAFDDAFFVLRSGLLGEVLQKFVNYRVRLAIIGDFSQVASKALWDFIYESNQGKNICFVPSEQAAIEKLTAAQ